MGQTEGKAETWHQIACGRVSINVTLALGATNAEAVSVHIAKVERKICEGTENCVEMLVPSAVYEV